MYNCDVFIGFGLIIIFVTSATVATQPYGLHHHKDISPTNAINTPPSIGLELQHGGQVQQMVKASDRTVRSTLSCKNSTTTKMIEVTYGDDVNITCSCQGIGVVKWYDAHCEVVLPSQRISFDSSTLFIKSFNASDPTPYQCRLFTSGIQESCSDMTEIAAVERVSGSSAGLVVLCLVLAAVLVILLCCLRKHKTGISLCMRDTCKANSGGDGKQYDAYISTGLSETDRHFIEAFLRDCLKKRYGYNLFMDEKNLLPKLDYSDKLQSNLHKCRRLIVIFSSSYMTHDWCMYCFNEGLRKIVELHVPTIFVITDHSILSEMRSHAEIIAHIPQIVLTQYQTSAERRQAIERIRQKMPPPMRSVSFRTKGGGGLRAPMLSDAESIHKSDGNLNGKAGTATYTENGTQYTFGSPPEDIAEEVQMEYDEAHHEPEGPDDFVTSVQTGQEIDPDKVKVHQYGARKDFYSLTMSEEDV